MIQAKTIYWVIAVFGLLALMTQQSNAVVLYEEHFDTDVIDPGDWIPSDPSVYVDTINGWLHIASGNVYGDCADKFINLTLPIVVETRMRLVSGGQHYTVPAIGIFYGPTNDEADYISYLPNSHPSEHFGWNFMDQFTDVHTMGPQSENQWLTIKAIIRADGGELLAKGDGDTSFTPIVSRNWSIPSGIVRLRFVQQWEAVCDMDYIRVTTVESVPPDTLYIPPVAFAPGEAIKVPVKVKCQTSTVTINGSFKYDNTNFRLDSLSTLGTACQTWTKSDTIDNVTKTIFMGLFDNAGDSIRSGWDTTAAYFFFSYIGPNLTACDTTMALYVDTTLSDDPVKGLFFVDNSNPPIQFVPAIDFDSITITLASYKPGDASNNGIVNALDITYIINYLYKHGVTPHCIDAADVNGNCAVNALDITYLINKLYKGGPALKYGCTPGMNQTLEKPRLAGSITSSYIDGKTNIELNSEASLAGLEMVLRVIDGKTVNIKSDIAGFELFSVQTGDEIKLGMFDLTGSSKIGNGAISILEIDGAVEIVSILGADENANGLAFEILNGASKGEILPGQYVLRPNHPNPFNPMTEISFALPKACDVTLDVYNIAGQKVATLVDGTLEAGEHTVQWDSRDQSGAPVASGIYLYRLTAGEFTDTKKMMLLK